VIKTLVNQNYINLNFKASFLLLLSKLAFYEVIDTPRLGHISRVLISDIEWPMHLNVRVDILWIWIRRLLVVIEACVLVLLLVIISLEIYFNRIVYFSAARSNISVV
jgi:hypothetical protein